MKSLSVTNCAFVELCHLKDGRDGVLSVAECGKQIPFDVKRVYYIYDLKDQSAIRGKHAHKQNRQVIFCINGSFTLELDDGVHRQKVTLDSPHIGIYMDVRVWHTMDCFSENCILLVLASDLFDENDYIRDYEAFKKYIQ
jgi:hypothetical protein